MKKRLKKKYTLCVRSKAIRRLPNTAETRALIGHRFKIACSDAGVKLPEVAQMLHVTERTVYAWFSGRTMVPYSAYKLIRILNRFELPGDAWAGWHMHSGKLWTPEGHGFEPIDGAWWSLLVRQARGFRAVYAELCQARKLVGASAEGRPSGFTRSDDRAASAPAALADGRRAAPAANSFLEHFRTQTGETSGATEGKQVD